MARTCPDCGWIWPKPTGPCPQCGSEAAPETVPGSTARTGRAKAPWHLKVLLGALAIYLVFRFWDYLGDAVNWVGDRF